MVKVTSDVAWRLKDNTTGKDKLAEPIVVPRGEAGLARRIAKDHGAVSVAIKYKGDKVVKFFDRQGRRRRRPDELLAFVLGG